MDRSLREVFAAHQGRSVGKAEHFFEVYERHLAGYRGRPLKILEIGVNYGGSLEIWREYFGPGAEIHGIDINEWSARKAPDFATVHVGSQADPVFLADIIRRYGPFDIVIDDGSHLMAHQIASFRAIFPTMPAHGVYICEDSFTSYWSAYGGGVGAPDTFIGYARSLIDRQHAYWHTDPPQEPDHITATLRSVTFYSGTTVIERSPMTPPVMVNTRKAERFAMTIAELKAGSTASVESSHRAMARKAAVTTA